VLGIAGIYGPNRLLRKIADLRAGVPLAVEPDQPLNLVHVDDAVRVIDSLRAAEDSLPPLINVVNSGTLTRRAYYSALAEMVNAPAPEFAPQAASAARGGNKVVVSRYARQFSDEMWFDNVQTGLQHAVENSQGE